MPCLALSMCYHVKSLNSLVRRPWLLLALYRGWAPESEVPCSRPQLGSGRARGQAQVCLLDFKSLISSLHLCAATCCIWLLDPWLCSVFVCGDIPCSSRRFHTIHPFSIFEHLLCPIHFGVTKVNKMMFLILRNSGLVRDADQCKWGGLCSSKHMGSEVPGRRE